MRSPLCRASSRYCDQPEKNEKKQNFLSYAGVEPEDLELLGIYLNRQLRAIKDACLTATQSQCLPRPSLFTACLINTPSSSLSRIARTATPDGKGREASSSSPPIDPHTRDANDKNANNRFHWLALTSSCVTSMCRNIWCTVK